MTALICGSMAYDTVMVFAGRFREHILPDRIHMLNVSFLVPTLQAQFRRLRRQHRLQRAVCSAATACRWPRSAAISGRTASWLERCGIDRSRVRTLDDEYTAQAFITTDLDDNQITAFHPGAMNRSHVNVVPTDAGITLGVIAPDGRDGMLQHATQFAAAGIPILFDPGQGLPMFDGAELRQFVELGALGRGQRLRGNDAQRTDRDDPPGDRARPRCADRDARRERQRDLRRTGARS